MVKQVGGGGGHWFNLLSLFFLLKQHKFPSYVKRFIKMYHKLNNFVTPTELFFSFVYQNSWGNVQEIFVHQTLTKIDIHTFVTLSQNNGEYLLLYLSYQYSTATQ